jgi:RNA polymerase sigma-70 factor (ECF subfamily)
VEGPNAEPPADFDGIIHTQPLLNIRSGGYHEGALDDRELVRGLLAKDSRAEKYFYDTFRPKLHRLSTYILGYMDPDVEDVVQESLMTAYANLSGFKFESGFYYWLYRICVFRCHTRVRKRMQHVIGLTTDIDYLARGVSIRNMEERETEHEQEVHSMILRAEWKRLDGKCRQLLEMWEGQGQSYAQLAETLKVPMGTMMSRLARCKEALKTRVLRALKLKGLSDE